MSRKINKLMDRENREALRKDVRKVLEKFNILPHECWNYFEIDHESPSSAKKEETHKKISENVGKKQGVYIHEKDGNVLYVGKGSDLKRRIKRHYQESYMKSSRFAKAQKAFFSRPENKGRLRIYYKEFAEEEDRRAIEAMVTFALRPSFEKFREDLKKKKPRTLSN